LNRARIRLWWSLRKARPVLRRPVIWLRHRGLLPDDVVLAHYPKSGSTWFTFMLGEILFRQPIDWENEGRLLLPVGHHRSAPRLFPNGGRLVRSYEPYRREYYKSVYLVRHVNDVTVSYFNWLQWWSKLDIAFQEFLPLFLAGHIDSHGSWAGHVHSWLDAAEAGADTLVITYEELRESPQPTLKRVLDHVGFQAEPDAIRTAIENNTIEKMREKEARVRATLFKGREETRQFVRKGAVGDWRNWLTDHDLRLIDRAAGSALARLGYASIPAEPSPGQER
jgi:hypothetical protein